MGKKIRLRKLGIGRMLSGQCPYILWEMGRANCLVGAGHARPDFQRASDPLRSRSGCPDFFTTSRRKRSPTSHRMTRRANVRLQPPPRPALSRSRRPRRTQPPADFPVSTASPGCGSEEPEVGYKLGLKRAANWPTLRKTLNVLFFRGTPYRERR